MIIVSQDKLKIINFDNIDSVRVDANLIYAFKNKEKLWIATYNTMNRAQEVLEEIAKTFIGTVESVTVDPILNKAIEHKKDSSIFYMPKD